MTENVFFQKLLLCLPTIKPEWFGLWVYFLFIYNFVLFKFVFSPQSFCNVFLLFLLCTAFKNE